MVQIANATVTWMLATQRATGHFISSAKTARNSEFHSLADILGPKPCKTRPRIAVSFDYQLDTT